MLLPGAARCFWKYSPVSPPLLVQRWSPLLHTTQTLSPSHIACLCPGGRKGPRSPCSSLPSCTLYAAVVYRPTPLKFSLSLHLLNYASLSANHGGLSRGSRSRPRFWETLTSSGPSWPQFLDILISMTFPAPQPCTPRVTQLVHLKS